MLLERLESGILLFETPQGLVPVELSLWQRAYLLWTFRNFRRLSLPLLNSRQASMVRAVAQQNAGRRTRPYDPSLVVGIIEGFKFLTIPASLAAEPKLMSLPVARPAIARAKTDLFGPVTSSLSSLGRYWRRPAWFKNGLPKLQLSQPEWTRFEWGKLSFSKFSTPRLATAAGVLFLAIGSIVAWHRMGAVVGSEAHTRPNQIESISQIESESLKVTGLRRTSVIESASTVVSSQPKALEMQESSPLASRGPSAVDIVKPAAATHPIASLTEHPSAVQSAESATKLVPAESGILATRPPLRSWYPDYSGIGGQGVVVLIADVDAEGVVRSVRVVRGNHALAAASIRAIRQWRYAPYFQDGKPVATETNIVISVFSDDAISMSFPPSVPASR